MSENIHPLVKNYMPMVTFIADTIGDNCEVVLHDLSDLNKSIVAIANGHVTGRIVGNTMTEISLKRIKEGEQTDRIINYTSKSIDGRVIKSSTQFIKDDSGETVGCLCVNFDMTELVAAKRVLDDLMKIDTVKEDLEKVERNKVNGILSDLVENSIKRGSKPVAYLSKDEKVAIVRQLEMQGAFLIKGAVDFVAEELCVSRYTIYNYLDEIKEKDERGK